MNKKFFKSLLFSSLILSFIVTGCSSTTPSDDTAVSEETSKSSSVEASNDEMQEEEFDMLSPAEVYVEGDAIIYNGDIHEESIQKVKDLYSENITKIVLNSLGGEINNGMDFGDFIFEKGLDVEIKNTAFSSAANYVALAAKNLYLNPNSLLGFHGGATQDDSAYEGIPEDQKAFLEEYLKASIERENLFYEKIGVDQKITTLGQDEKYDDIAEGKIGYTYSLEALKALGVDNIVLTENEWTTPTVFEDDADAHLFVIENVE